MQMIRAIVRPEKVDCILKALMESGFPSVTKVPVVGRGKQKGITLGDIVYDELPKEMIIIVAKDEDKDFLLKTIITNARSGENGAFGDGKIFISPVDEVVTVSSGSKEL
jgi:nitrogen regulatory protein PII 1